MVLYTRSNTIVTQPLTQIAQPNAKITDFDSTLTSIILLTNVSNTFTVGRKETIRLNWCVYLTKQNKK